MKKILLIVFAFISVSATAQSLFPTQFDNCNTKMFFLEGKEIYSECNLNDYLSELKKEIGDENLTKMKGQITFQIIINEEGIPCCQSLKNELKGKGKKLDFKNIVDQIQTWGAPLREGKKSTVCAILKLIIGKDTIKIQRLGFNGKTGLVLLDQFSEKK